MISTQTTYVTYCKTDKDFWRHRSECDYLVKGRTIYRMGDGLVYRRCGTQRSLDAAVKFLRGGKKPMKVKVTEKIVI